MTTLEPCLSQLPKGLLNVALIIVVNTREGLFSHLTTWPCLTPTLGNLNLVVGWPFKVVCFYIRDRISDWKEIEKQSWLSVDGIGRFTELLKGEQDPICSFLLGKNRVLHCAQQSLSTAVSCILGP